jgi:hypothetical protein
VYEAGAQVEEMGVRGGALVSQPAPSMPYKFTTIWRAGLRLEYA